MRIPQRSVLLLGVHLPVCEILENETTCTKESKVVNYTTYIPYHCRSCNQTSARIAWAKGPIGTVVPGTVVPMGPNRSPCRSPISQSSRLRRAGWCSSSSHISPGHLQPLLQLQNRRLPTFCLLQVVQRHPLTIEALDPVGVGLEFEPAVDVVLDAFVALVIVRIRRRVASVHQRPWDDR